MIETQTIDIRHVRQVLASCPHYDYIVNYEYSYGDNLSRVLIDWYRELIFSASGEDSNQLKVISAIDNSLYLYVKDSKYKRGLKQILTVDDFSLQNKYLIKEVIKKIISFTNSYEKNTVLEIDNSKWL